MISMKKVDKKHIACFQLYNDYSGSPKVLASVLGKMLDDGFTVDLYTSTSTAGALDTVIDRDGLRLIGYKYTFSDTNRLITFVRYLRVQFLIFFLAFRYAFRKDTVFYINTILPVGAAVAAWICRKRIVYHYHENAFAKSGSYRFLAALMEKLADEIICVSKYQASFLKRKVGVRVVPNALPKSESDALMPNTEMAFTRKSVLMLSSLKDYKGTLDFVRIAMEMPQFNFVLVINDIEENIERYFREKCVDVISVRNLTIYPRQKDVATFYNNASLVLNLTDKTKAVETFGLTVLEAATCALPAIVPTVGGIAEFVKEGFNGFKTDVSDIGKIKEQIASLLTDHDAYCQMARCSLGVASQYTLDRVVPDVEDAMWDFSEIPDLNSRFLEVVRVSLGLQENFSSEIDEITWRYLIRLAAGQAVTAMAFVGMQRYNKEVCPVPRYIYKRFLQYAVAVNNINQKHCTVLARIHKHLVDKGISHVFIKGLTAGARYPKPELRQCGDIDFVTDPSDFRKTLTALSEIGKVSPDFGHEHHGMAKIDGVSVEPHFKVHNFQNPRNDKAMMDIFFEVFPSELTTVDVAGSCVNAFPATMEALLYVSHMVNHVYEEGLGLRQVLDFAMFLRNLGDGLPGFDEERYSQWLSRMHMERADRIFTRICEKFLGVDPAIRAYRYSDKECRFADKMMDDILSVGNFGRMAFRSEGHGLMSSARNYFWVCGRVFKFIYLCPSEAAYWPLYKGVRFFYKKIYF